ncbi:MAG: RluA family pseudouridine synthase [Pseudomonadota bacterium]|nr:RluA family pseudouridine synthase [Pseudomonadota bacterium]
MSDPTVLSSDGDLVAVSKPTGWVVHAAMADERYDLRAWLAAQPTLPKGLEPLHRLDRETSGVVLYAASAITRATVGRYFMDGTVHKSYLALVQGHAHKKGVIRVPLAPDDGGAPQEAITRYRLEEALGGFSLLRVTPETGRKHQIRRHLHGLGLSVVGDDRYVARKKLRIPAYPGRMFLHAARIELPDGRVFEAPLPPELERCVVALRARPERPKVEGDPF